MKIVFPYRGQIRYRDEFLIFPKQINDVLRWLERAKWAEKFDGLNWQNIYWLDMNK